MRNDVISFQRFLTKARSSRKKNLIAKLLKLKNNITVTLDEIKLIEAELTSLQDEEMKAKLAKTRHFDILKNEK
jgi:hypothetical protein